MIDLLLLATLNAFLIIGFYTACLYEVDAFSRPYEDSKMILWRFRKWSVDTFGLFWSKPICTCPPCMASLHSILPLVLFSNITDCTALLYGWPLYALIVSGITKLLYKLTEL